MDLHNKYFYTNHFFVVVYFPDFGDETPTAINRTNGADGFVLHY